MKSKQYKHVTYLWDEVTAASLKGDEVGLLIYRSNLLGADLRLTNYGGGNTSCKVKSKDPVTGKETEVIWIKGSGGDLGTLKKSGLAALYVDRLIALKNIYRGVDYEDEMVELFNHCIFSLSSKAPSIDTPLHGFLPFKHIDHLHPDAAIAIAAAKDGKKITEELFNGTIGWVGWQRPGFELGLQMKRCLDENPGISGIMLGAHGLFTWGDTAFESYINTLNVVECCAQYLEDSTNNSIIFGGEKIKPLPNHERLKKASFIAPVLRGFCSSTEKMIGHFTDDPRVMQFINSKDLDKLALMGTSCPDHFLRTKISPLVLTLEPTHDIDNVEELKTLLKPQFDAYRTMYAEYYESCRHANSPVMRDANPVVIIYPGVGMFTFAKDKQTARVASEFYTNAINVMRGAESISEYASLPRQEAFNIEYWLLEEAKLQRLPKPKSLSGQIAMVTGSGGGIGKAVAKKFADEGACVILNDIDESRLKSAHDELRKMFGNDNIASVMLDVTNEESILKGCEVASLLFGGIDIIVNNAGISISKKFTEHSLADWNKLYDILVKGQFLVSRSAVEVMKKQDMGGDIINIVSKNAVFAGPNNAGYGSAKAAQAHLSRLMAAELGSNKIRVNIVNPDAVIEDSSIWSGGWAEGRAEAYGIPIEELPSYYAKRTLLNESILPDDIANACFVFVGGLLGKSTGNILNVDGGVAAAFVR